jgi:hypothetical protein
MESDGAGRGCGENVLQIGVQCTVYFAADKESPGAEASEGLQHGMNVLAGCTKEDGVYLKCWQCSRWRKGMARNEDPQM